MISRRISLSANSPSVSAWRICAVILDGDPLVFQIETKHRFGLFRGLHRLWRDGRHAAEIVNLLGQLQGVLEFLGGVYFKLAGDIHVLGAFENLAVIHVGDDCLILALNLR